jgi:hypothetical protein
MSDFRTFEQVAIGETFMYGRMRWIKTSGRGPWGRNAISVDGRITRRFDGHERAQLPPEQPVQLRMKQESLLTRDAFHIVHNEDVQALHRLKRDMYNDTRVAAPEQVRNYAKRLDALLSRVVQA